MTPHISAKLNEIAEVVLMPGDPLRAKWIAEKFLKKPKLINEVRGMLGYTGTYKNKKVTVFAHGMGMPSIGIYSYELFDVYKVKTIIRIGSCGSYKKNLNVGDLIVTRDVVSHSVFAHEVGIKITNHTIKTNPKMLNLALQTAKQSNIKISQARVACTDTFYNRFNLIEQAKRWKNSDVVEMESFALYCSAIKLKKQAICLLTVSDSFVTKKQMSPIERQTSMNNMVKLALEMSVKLYEL